MKGIHFGDDELFFSRRFDVEKEILTRVYWRGLIKWGS